MCVADLQMVNMTLRFLSKPSEKKLSEIFKVGQQFRCGYRQQCGGSMKRTKGGSNMCRGSPTRQVVRSPGLLVVASLI